MPPIKVAPRFDQSIGTGRREPVEAADILRCQPFAIVNQRIAVRVIAATTSLAVQQPAADIGVLKRTSIFVLELVGATAPAAVAQALPFGFAHSTSVLRFQNGRLASSFMRTDYRAPHRHGSGVRSVEHRLDRRSGEPRRQHDGTLHPVNGTAVKRLELLKELVPQVRRIAILQQPANPGHPMFINEIDPTAALFGFTYRIWEARGSGDFESGFALMRAWPADAVFVLQCHGRTSIVCIIPLSSCFTK